MADMDTILSIVENPTRRKILQAVVREPHYPLQLSKELGISQQAVVKNLNLMEKEGLVESYHQSSDRGPDRIFYRPSSEFSITIDMRNSMFEVRMIPTGNTKSQASKDKAPAQPAKTHDERRLESVRADISAIDRQLNEFDRKRCQLVQQRNDLIDSFLAETDIRNLDYEHRQLLYDMLNRPNWSAGDISRNLGFNESTVSEMISDIMKMVRME